MPELGCEPAADVDAVGAHGAFAECLAAGEPAVEPLPNRRHVVEVETGIQLGADILRAGQWLFGPGGVLDKVTDSGARGDVVRIGDGDQGADLVDFGFGVAEGGKTAAAHGASGAVVTFGEFDLQVPHAVVGAPGAVAAA